MLADKLGYSCLAREEMIEAATEEGIHVGKLEMAMVKPGIFSERLALEKDHYLAFSTAYLCERTNDSGLVYHGRTGHLLLPGVSHVLRVRVLADREYRIQSVMQRLGLDQRKARQYIEGVDEDREKWVHSMYGISLEAAANFDIVVNLAQMSMENAAAALTHVAQLPDFQMTPASRRTMDDILLAARARMAIARDERTHGASVKVRADSGVVTVTYLPQDSSLADAITAACTNLPGLKDIRTAMATTNLLWIGEEFQEESETYKQVVEIASKWNAAVELVRLAPEEEPPPGEERVTLVTADRAAGSGGNEDDGKIEDDVPEEQTDVGGLSKTLDELARIGMSGGGKVVYGGQRQLVDAMDKTIPYTLVVIGNVFMSKGHSARLRATRDLRRFLSDRVKAPIVTSDELGGRYLFGTRDILKAAVFLILACVIYLLVFTNQETVLAFLANAGWYAEAVKDTLLARVDWGPRIIVSIAVFLIVPIVAYSYGTVARVILKLIKME